MYDPIDYIEHLISLDSQAAEPEDPFYEDLTEKYYDFLDVVDYAAIYDEVYGDEEWMLAQLVEQQI